MEKKTDWVFTLKPNVLKFLDEMKSHKRRGYFRYSYSGDLYDERRKWNAGASVFAMKIYYTLGIKKDQAIEDAAQYIKSFQKTNGLIYDDLICRKTFLRNMFVSLKNRSFTNLLNEQYKRAETRQCYSALMLYGKLPDNVSLFVPKDERDVDSYLSSLSWDEPWGAGSHFSHLMFFLTLALKTKKIKNETCEYLGDCAIKWVNHLQHPEDGAWYLANPGLQQKINGAMKIISGLIAVDRIDFDYPEKLIDLCLGSVNDQNACDNFNIIFVLNYAAKLLDRNYRQSDIEKFALQRLNIYRKHYHNDKNGFSFYPDRANDIYCGARITRALNEPDIHGTVLFLWGISIIVQLLGMEKELKFREFKA
jgi:hypothetical protein